MRQTIALLMLVVTACSDRRTNPAAARVAMDSTIASAPAAAPAPAVAGDQVASVTRLASSVPAPGTMLIRTGTASIEVASVAQATERARTIVGLHGGVIANVTVQGGRDQQRTATMDVRVPPAQFDSLVRDLAPLGRVESVAVRAEDVGEEYVDVQARLTNAKRLDARLEQLLATRAGKLADVLEMERELARVREEIERLEGRQHYLERSVGMSTLTLSLREPATMIAGHSAGGALRTALVVASQRAVNTVASLIELLGVVIPLVVVGVGAWLGVRWVRHRVDMAGGA